MLAKLRDMLTHAFGSLADVVAQPAIVCRINFCWNAGASNVRVVGE